MFTGIVEEMGTIKEKKQISKGAIQFTITAQIILTDMHVGDSISVNGVCLTVTGFSNTCFSVEMMPETAHATSLGTLAVGDSVNLERSVAANGRFGGHFVTGHVDSTGEIAERSHVENAIYYKVNVPETYMKYFTEKGSVAIDGVSLTIFSVGNSDITIAIIPHTASETILGQKKEGDIVNIECDMLAKQVERQLNIKAE